MMGCQRVDWEGYLETDGEGKEEFGFSRGQIRLKREYLSSNGGNVAGEGCHSGPV